MANTRHQLATLVIALFVAQVSFAETYLAESHTQILAASCAACHGTQGNSIGGTPVLAGLNADYFIQQMKEFSSGARASTVMHRHAKGLTIDEINALAFYFSNQIRKPAQLPAKVDP